MIGDFVTERLALRPLKVERLNLFVGLNSDPAVMECITGRASTVEETADELKGSLGARWLVFEREGMDFLGWVGAIPSPAGEEYEIGWRFKRAAWGRGFATEATRELIDRVFATGAQRVFAETIAVNTRSRAVMERLGLRTVGRACSISRTRSRAPWVRSSTKCSVPSGMLGIDESCPVARSSIGPTSSTSSAELT